LQLIPKGAGLGHSQRASSNVHRVCAALLVDLALHAPNAVAAAFVALLVLSCAKRLLDDRQI
jgi:hypothetical protein